MIANIGLASCGIAAGAEDIQKALHKKGIKTKTVGCIGACHLEPIIEFKKEDYETIIFCSVKTKDLSEILKALKSGKLHRKILAKRKDGKEWYPKVKYIEDICFYKKQQKILSHRCGIIDPADVDEYVKSGGYDGLQNAIKMKKEEVIAEVEKSGLRGRGGAGFSTGKKWSFVKNAKERPFMVCNADEGDPGAFMNRILLESDPLSVIEGLTIAGYAINARQGIIYIRSEYPLAVERLKHAIKNATKKGFLGNNILNSGFSFDIEIKLGAGAFVCGEETALIASLEGKTGRPHPRPPYPTDKGLLGKPTVINNVETLACVSLIMAKGSGYFRKFGTETSPGTKIFSLSGALKKTGYIEVPFGIKLREVLEIADVKEDEFKVMHLGGPAGSCLPKELLDLNLDYDNLKSVNATLGSGSMILLNHDQDMVEFAKNMMAFNVSESCGKCVPCREGTKRMLELIEKILRNDGKPEDLVTLEHIASTVKDTSLCGLGQSASNPLISILKYFKGEYIDKLQGAISIANDLAMYRIIEVKCTGCDKCSEVCPMKAIRGKKFEVHQIDEARCIKCGRCSKICPVKAVDLVKMERAI